ncbi:MAG: murein transglycosylase A [Phyllobacteriaceae bacterium]|nr:murein transglycosylase A [Phyllobacteriaceae bacterium]
MGLAKAFAPVGFADLPGWAADGHGAAYAAFRRSALRAAEKPYRSGSLGVDVAFFEPAFAEARLLAHPDQERARSFFERHFTPCRVAPDNGRAGLVTGFYEPVADASQVPDARFATPLLARPADLVDVDESNRPPGLDPYLAFGRATPTGIVEYHDRRSIETGALVGRGLEMAWLDSKVDAFFIHVQGAARLRFPDGAVRRITYAAKSGQRFTGPGRLLIDAGEIAEADVSMQAIRAWFARNPDRIDEFLWQNRSYIFFREAAVDDPELGPVAAAKVPLTPGRSVAVDRLLHTFATPFFIDAPKLTAFGGSSFHRLMIAQDTGSAIIGAARGDLFAGSGDTAGEIAGAIKAEATFYALLPNALLRETAR